jgi:molecular chaperone DnaJ
MNKDYYKILEINRNANESEIKKAYRKMAMKYHPDKNPGDVQAEEKFKEAAEAFSILSDPDKKQQYDRFGTVGDIHMNFDFNDIFSSFGDIFSSFGSDNDWFENNRNYKKGHDLKISIDVDINTVINGDSRRIKYKRDIKCEKCNGKGGETQKCYKCDGRGKISNITRTPFGIINKTTRCDYCNGMGETIKERCEYCKGHGFITEDDIVDIEIPKGISNNMVFVMEDYGSYTRNGSYGDLNIVIKEQKYDSFKRDGNNILIEKEISVVEAILGNKIEIISPVENININVHPGTAHETVLRIKGKGLPSINNEIGDLYIKLLIKIPTNINDTEKQLLKELGKSENFKNTN